MNSATALPAFSINVSEGTPNFSVLARSISRISAAVVIFMHAPRPILPASAALRIAHGNQVVTLVNHLVGRRIEAHCCVLALDGKHNHAQLLPDARAFQRLSGET